MLGLVTEDAVKKDHDDIPDGFSRLCGVVTTIVRRKQRIVVKLDNGSIAGGEVGWFWCDTLRQNDRLTILARFKPSKSGYEMSDIHIHRPGPDRNLPPLEIKAFGL